jgi:hypothetical protein
MRIALILGLLVFSILTTMDYLEVAKENSQLKEKIEKLENYDEEVGIDSLHVTPN